MKRLICLALTLLVTPIFAGEPDVRLHKKCLYPTVFIRSADKSHTGSGVVIKSVFHQESKHWLNTVLTNAHVIDQAKVVFEPATNSHYEVPRPKYDILVGQYVNWSTFSNYLRFDAHVRRTDYKKDICVLNFWSKTEMHAAEVDVDQPLYIGDDILKVGCGLGEEMRLDFGKITSTDSVNQSGRLRTSLCTVPGDSGGPVFYDYKLIGITQSVRLMETQEGLKIPVTQISYVIPIGWFKDTDLLLREEKAIEQLEPVEAPAPKPSEVVPPKPKPDVVEIKEN